MKAGLFGLVSYTLERRLKEIGIRIALGAITAFAIMRLLSALLYGVSCRELQVLGFQDSRIPGFQD